MKRKSVTARRRASSNALMNLKQMAEKRSMKILWTRAAEKFSEWIR